MKADSSESRKGNASSLVSAGLLARNATLNLVTEGCIFLVLIFAIPKLVFYLGEASFGLFSIAWVVVGYLAFLDIGVSSATTKFTSELLAKGEKSQVASLVRTALAANSVMGIFAGSVAVAVSPLLIRYAFKIPPALHSEALSVFIAVAFALPFLLVQGVLRAALSSYQRFDWINLVNGSAISLQWVVMTLLAWRGQGVVTVVWVAVVARAVMVVVYGFLLLRIVPDVFRRLHFCWETLWRLLHFGAWVSVSQIMSPILVYLDRMMIAAMVSLQAVTIYTIPTEVFNRLGVLPSSLMATLFPAFSHHGATGTDNGQMSRLFNTTTRYLLLAILPVFAFLFVSARDILTVWMGPSFAAQGTRVLQILAVGALINFLARLPYGAVQAVGRPDITGRFHLLELPVYVALCSVLIPRWGIEGAALACTLRLFVDAGLMFWAARKYCQTGVTWMGGSIRPAAIVALLAACFVGAQYFMRDVWARLGTNVGLLSLAYVMVWYFALDGEDKPAILRTLGFPGQEAAQ
jgi:O-antigen/teichoic acid export membrane protein